MAFFQVDLVEVEIQTQGSALQYERIGPTFRTYNGGFRSQVRAQKRTWQGDTPPLTFSAADALVSAIGLGITTIGGDWPGATVDVYVEIINDTPVKDASESIDARRVLTLKATEI